jgi:murein DD-endopeptidase MepM/ murein hydrolase activator NlpD
LGGVGETGYVDSPQLHFEIRKDRKPIDPLTKLPAR